MIKTIAVTGSSGFIGSKLVDSLRKDGFELLELDLKNRFDLTDNNCLEKIKKFDVVVHLAAKSFVPDSFIYPKQFYSDNYTITLNILELARKFNSKVIFFSSYVYGTPRYLPIDESHPLEAHNPYAQSKIICEKLCEGYARDFDLPVIIFRPFNIYGTGQNFYFLIPTILNQVKTGLVKLQDSRPKRDFIFVDDVISAIRLVISSSTPHLDVFNLGYGVSYSISDIINTIRDIYPYEFDVEFSGEIRKNEVMDIVADTSHAKVGLLWEPKVSLKEGIAKMVKEI
jgi:nucleoside-diphosphate-sugar epimerase